MSDPRWATPDRIAQCLGEDRKLRPWPLYQESPRWTMAPGQHWWDNPHSCEMSRGFVGNSRFASQPGERVIPRTNRNVTRKWYRSGERRA